MVARPAAVVPLALAWLGPWASIAHKGPASSERGTDAAASSGAPHGGGTARAASDPFPADLERWLSDRGDVSTAVENLHSSRTWVFRRGGSCRLLAGLRWQSKGQRERDRERCECGQGGDCKCVARGMPGVELREEHGGHTGYAEREGELPRCVDDSGGRTDLLFGDAVHDHVEARQCDAIPGSLLAARMSGLVT